MSPAIRSALWGFVVLNAASAGRAQHAHGGGRPGAGGQPHPMGHSPSAMVPGLGIVGAGGYYPGSLAFNSGSLGFNAGLLGFNGFYGGFGFGAGFGVDPLFTPFGQGGPGGMMLPTPIQTSSRTNSTSSVASSQRKSGSSRADELTEVGDRSFRGGNYHRAEDRYQLAAKANRESPTPHIHLAQVSMVRGRYSDAAAHFRDAVAAVRGPGWLLEAPDIQAMYGEPADFHKQLANLESHLQTHPNDRDGWFVLGAQQYFSGHHQAAADAFLRLSDRVPDVALTAFRDATTVASRAASARNNEPER